MISVTCQHCSSRFDVQSLPASESLPIGSIACPVCHKPAISTETAAPAGDAHKLQATESSAQAAVGFAQATWPPPPIASSAPLAHASQASRSRRVTPEVPLPEELLVGREAEDDAPLPQAMPRRRPNGALRFAGRSFLMVATLAALALWRPSLVRVATTSLTRATHAVSDNPEMEAALGRAGQSVFEHIASRREDIVHRWQASLGRPGKPPQEMASSEPLAAGTLAPAAPKERHTAFGETELARYAKVAAPELLVTAEKYLAAGDITHAAPLFELAVTREPSLAALHGLATCQLEEQDFEGARATLTRGLEMDLDHAEFYFDLARAEQGRGNVRAMNHALRQFLLREPRGDKSVDARRMLGTLGP